ncbi:MalY/PatB family protein [Ralstonia pseudosolanacearum]|uniref:MalY/PatB family protein n=1 Tax=Ralstonia pseudosolanacearum TaxID=1310165 RepID=UPI00210D9E44|nr:aminotransferase class I/II-fold pyridoxal phosphate-dependent enzyme [Ralstonia pseudosolanacearum]MCQ4681139.1 aminotransferase class I/II-fold pyridoxal phosphate-dependent enzyme [Ralstonia pseudosolanacearum]
MRPRFGPCRPDHETDAAVADQVRVCARSARRAVIPPPGLRPIGLKLWLRGQGQAHLVTQPGMAGHAGMPPMKIDLQRIRRNRKGRRIDRQRKRTAQCQGDAPAPLVLEDGRYRFDAAIFEQAIRDDTRLFIPSNPHNPTGNVWSEDDLRTMGEICLRHGILVIADEIHQDFVLAPSRRHLPFAALDPRFAAHSLTCTSASKTFNLAGLQCANLIISDRRLRDTFIRQLERNQFNVVNLLGMVATEAAYARGEPWLEAMLAYIRANQQHFAATVNAADWGLRVHEMDALYLAWIDCRPLGLSAEALEHFMLTRARIWFDKGQKFGAEGHGFLRANLGCPRAVVDDALARLAGAM